MLLYYITDRTQFPGAEAERRERVTATAVAAAEAGVDFIQLREKDLTGRELEAMACELVRRLKEFPQARFLVNSRVDVAIACGAPGVHLPADDISASEARTIFAKAGVKDAVIASSCHSSAEIERAESHGADFAVFGPVFGKQGASSPAAGLSGLREVCNRPLAVAAKMPVLALGGITVENAAACMACGAAGVAGIRLFQTDDPGSVVMKLRKAGKNASEYRHEAARHPYWPAPKQGRPKG